MNTFPRFVLAVFLLTGVFAQAQGAGLGIRLVSTFDYPGSTYQLSWTGQISNRGEIVGGITDQHGFQGFKLRVNRRFSQPIFAPGTKETDVSGVNNSGVICGGAGTHGFFLFGNNFTRYDVPGYLVTSVIGINDAGSFVGTCSSGTERAYLKSGGNITIFTVPTADASIASGINGLNQIVGSYLIDVARGFYDAFFRDADGTLIYPLDYPGSISSVLDAINDDQLMVGHWEDSHSQLHGYLVELPDTFVSFDAPNSTQTLLTGINNSGRIVGYYTDNSGVIHGFVAQAQRDSEEITR